MEGGQQPASVTVMRRVVRCKSVTPTLRSRRWICLVTADLPRPNASAAAVKPPMSTTFTNTSRSAMRWLWARYESSIVSSMETELCM
jgi:hypothetical protein